MLTFYFDGRFRNKCILKKVLLIMQCLREHCPCQSTFADFKELLTCASSIEYIRDLP